MSRRFDGTDDEVRYPVQTGSNFTGAFTIGFLIRRAVTGAVWGSILSHVTSTPGVVINLEVSGNTAGRLWLDTNATGGGDSAAITGFTTTTDWLAIVVTKASGTVAPRLHWKNLTTGSAWTHVNLGFTAANANSHAGGTIRLGEWLDGDDLNAWLALDFGWASVLTDLEIEGLFTNSRTQDLLDLHATKPAAYIHQHNQATATVDIVDLAGNAHTATGTITSTTDTSGIQGTSIDTANEPPGWTYYTAGGSTQTVTLAGVASAEAVGAAVVSPGAVNVTLAGVASSEAVGALTVSPGAVAITLTGVASSEAVGSATVTPGPVSLTLTGVGSSEAVGAATVQPGAVTVTLAGVGSAEAAGAPTINSGGTISLTGVPSAGAAGNPTITVGAVNVTLAGVASSEAVGSATVSPGPVTVTLTGVPSAGAIGAPVVTAIAVIAPAGVPSSEAVGAAAVTVGPVSVNLTGVPSAGAVGALILFHADARGPGHVELTTPGHVTGGPPGHTAAAVPGHIV